MILGFGDQQSGHQRAKDGREADRCGRKRRADHYQQAGGQEELGALGPGGLRKQVRQCDPANCQQCHDHQRALPQRVEHRRAVLRRAAAAHCSKQEDDRDQGDILEQQHGQSGPAHRCARIGDTQHQRGRGEGQREPQGKRCRRRVAQYHQRRANQQRADYQLQCTETEDVPAHRP